MNIQAFIPSVLVLLSVTAMAGDPKAPVETVLDSAWSSPLFGFGVKTNDAYTDANLFLTLPIWSTIGNSGKLGGNYLLVEPYTSRGDGGEVASSLGLGYRHLFSDESVSALDKKGQASLMEEGWFLGSSLFVDRMDTQHRNTFWQLGVGAEIGTRYFELRGNYYIPLTSRELVQRDVTTQTFTDSSTRYNTVGSSSSTGNSVPFAQGNAILQDYGSQTTYATTTTRTTKVRTITEIFEKGMQGWDAELGILIPWVDQWMDVKVLGGYFSFDNQPFGPQSYGTGHVHGWKGGLEVRPIPALVLTGMWYEDARFTGSNWTVGAQIQIPLGKDWKDAFRPRRRHLVEHLAEPVHRQNDAIKVGNSQEQKQTSTTSLARVTRVVSQSPGRIVLLDDVVFVNNGAAVGNGIQAGEAAGNGTAEHPVQDLSVGASIAATNAVTGRVWNVYTQSGGGDYSGKVTVNASANFISSATKITAPDGQTFGTGGRPTLKGRLETSGVNVFGIRDYIIANTFEGPALSITNVKSATVLNNDLSSQSGGGGRGIDISTLIATSSTVVFRGNTVHDINGNGVEVFANTGSNLSVTFDGNVITKTLGKGVNTTRFGGAPLNFSGTLDNTFSLTAGGNYVQFGAPAGSFFLNGTSVSSAVNH